jgi:glyoxylase-like metal-dependent hydrolase (beta-lactamase superfamily II)
MLKELKVERIVVTDYETNCYLIRKENSKFGILIDPGGDISKIRNKLKENNLEIEAILITHGHADHIGAVSFFKSPVFIHEKDANFLKNSYLNLSELFYFPIVINIKPNIFEDNEKLQFKKSDLTFKVIHTPGHTPGSSCFLINGILFSGDTLFKEGIGRVDLPAGSLQDLGNSIKKKLYLLDSNLIVYPGWAWRGNNNFT